MAGKIPIEIELREYTFLDRHSVILVNMHDSQINRQRYFIIYVLEFVEGYKDLNVREISELQCFQYIDEHKDSLQVERTYANKGTLCSVVRYLYQWVPENKIYEEKEEYIVNKYNGWMETFKKEEICLLVLETNSRDSEPIMIDINKVEIARYNKEILTQGISIKCLGNVMNNQKSEDLTVFLPTAVGIEYVMINNQTITKKTDMMVQYNLARRWALKTVDTVDNKKLGMFIYGEGTEGSKIEIGKVGRNLKLELCGFSSSLWDKYYGYTSKLPNFAVEVIRTEINQAGLFTVGAINNIPYEEAVRIATTEEGNPCKELKYLTSDNRWEDYHEKGNKYTYKI